MKYVFILNSVAGKGKIAKDTAAGAVLIAAIFAVLVGIAILGVKALFSGKSKKGGFFSKLNPKNWFGKKAAPAPIKTEKTSFWSKLKFWK